MKSIVRRDTGEDWKQYVRRLMKDEGVLENEEPTDEEIRRFDKNRKHKKVSNDEWVSASIPRPDHAVERRPHASGVQGRACGRSESDLILAAEIRPADHGDSQTLVDSVFQACVNLKAASRETRSKRSWPTKATTRPRPSN